ncbi:hypothetical protein SDC9_137888 [bioreactor metagenome]|uniref:Uncharacterized protein n=1 Tax=bioreactor metagenome TaxID=1076179 RepID=A0A645DN94_9ZZZZ
MLTDDDGASGHQSIGGFAFSDWIIPGIGVLNIHMSFGNDGLDSQKERGVAADHFRIGECPDITDIRIFDFSFVHEFLQLLAGNNAGNIAGFIDIWENILQVGQFGWSSQIACRCDKGDFRILSGSTLHVHLMTVRVGEYDGTALFSQVHCRVISFFIFRNIVFENNLSGRINAQFLGGVGYAFQMSCVITGVRVMQCNKADLDVWLFCRCGGWGRCRSSSGRGSRSGNARGCSTRGSRCRSGRSAGSQTRDHSQCEK